MDIKSVVEKCVVREVKRKKLYDKCEHEFTDHSIVDPADPDNKLTPYLSEAFGKPHIVVFCKNCGAGKFIDAE